MVTKGVYHKMLIKANKIESVNTELIKTYLAKNNITRNQFAKLCHMSILTLNRILDGKPNYKLESLLKISETMNVETKTLFTKKR